MRFENAEDQLLSDLNIFSELELEFFRSYNIHSLEQLLSATKGLERITIFDAFLDKETKLEKLRDLVSNDILQKHKEFIQEHPTGVLEDEENNSEIQQEIF